MHWNTHNPGKDPYKNQAFKNTDAHTVPFLKTLSTCFIESITLTSYTSMSSVIPFEA
jgi:hypothetical protein